MIQDYVGDNIGFAEDNTHLSLYKDALVLFFEGDIAKKVFDLSADSGSELLETEFDNKKFTYTRINESLVCVKKYNNIAINLFYSDYSYRCMELHRVDGDTESYEPSRLVQSIFRSFELF